MDKMLITIRYNTEYNTITLHVNGKKEPNEKIKHYLEELEKFPNYKMEKYSHDNWIIKQYITIGD